VRISRFFSFRFFSLCLVLAFGVALANSAKAAEVLSAELDGAKKNILLQVRHGGGCGEHDYALKLKGCFESMPVQCQAELVHKTNDFCEALLHRTAVINLEASGIKGDYYSGGSLTISGSNGSKVTVELPETATPMPPFVPPTVTREPAVSCKTHTGSTLTVWDDGKLITLVKVDGRSSDYGITGTEVRILESIPEVFQTRYKLDDGRTVVIEFRGKSQVGTGYFVRLAGDTSPNFPSCERM
jgi:hypothetical protein